MPNFERNRDVKDVLDLGIRKNLPVWMKDSFYDYDDYFDVWKWAIEEEKDIMFPYIVEKKGKKWWGKDTIIIGMEDNNSLLWESVSSMCYPAVRSILKIPNLFSEEVLTMELGAIPLNETFMRRDTRINYRATNLGAFAQLAMTNGKGDWRILDALKKYYEDSIK